MNESRSALPIGKVVCVGRNYAEHARELGNAIPDTPVLFIKPASSVIGIDKPIAHQWVGGRTDAVHPIHYEAELCVQVIEPLVNASEAEALAAIGYMTLGLDLTLRDLQSQLKAQGYPWERAKSFMGSCVLAPWLAVDASIDFTKMIFSLDINGQRVQTGDTSAMLFGIGALLSEISHVFGLQAGDVVMTGTPSGVGQLQAGDALTLTLMDVSWQVAVAS